MHSFRATCVYLSCKTEEFNVSISQFVSNIKGDKLKAMDIILSNELLLMQQLNYYLTVHNPFRPIEGFLIDIKTRCSLSNPERLRAGIDDFIDKTFLTDACLLYAPSQVCKFWLRKRLESGKRLRDTERCLMVWIIKFEELRVVKSRWG